MLSRPVAATTGNPSGFGYVSFGIGMNFGGMRPVKRTLWGLVAVVGLFGAACSQTSLDTAGDRSTGWIGRAPITEATAVTVFGISTLPSVEAFDLTSAGGLNWSNDELDSVVADGGGESPSQILATIWAHSSGVDEFVQAPRVDISSGIPGIKFPGAVPSGVNYVTSQVVFRLSGGTLGDPWFVAFGLWDVPPYSERREESQSAVLLVGPNPDTSAEASRRLCPVTQIEDALSCEEVELVSGRAALVQVEDGVRLQWAEGSFRYQLFYREPSDPSLPALVAESLVELASLDDQAFEAYRRVADLADSATG